MTEKDHGPQSHAPDAAEKRPYRTPALSRIGSVRDMTMKGGSANDTLTPGLTKPSNNPN